jgi:hypothetical protein
VAVNDRPSGPLTGAGADTGPGGAVANSRPAQRLIAALLLTAAALDLARCGLVLATMRYPTAAAGLVAAGLAAAALSGWTARGCLGGRRWPTWAALLIGAASAPQAATSGFHPPFTVPDTITAVLGILLAVAVLATFGRTKPGRHTENPCTIDREATR